jgi:hypothetical protein
MASKHWKQAQERVIIQNNLTYLAGYLMGQRNIIPSEQAAIDLIAAIKRTIQGWQEHGREEEQKAP